MRELCPMDELISCHSCVRIVQKCKRVEVKFATLVAQYLQTESTEENSEEY